jgi:hypothetical protein
MLKWDPEDEARILLTFKGKESPVALCCDAVMARKL